MNPQMAKLQAVVSEIATTFREVLGADGFVTTHEYWLAPYYKSDMRVGVKDRLIGEVGVKVRLDGSVFIKTRYIQAERAAHATTRTFTGWQTYRLSRLQVACDTLIDAIQKELSHRSFPSLNFSQTLQWLEEIENKFNPLPEVLDACYKFVDRVETVCGGPLGYPDAYYNDDRSVVLFWGNRQSDCLEVVIKSNDIHLLLNGKMKINGTFDNLVRRARQLLPSIEQRLLRTS